MKKHHWKALFLFGFILQFLSSCESDRNKNDILLYENLDFEFKKSPRYFKGKKYTGPIVKYHKNGTLEFIGNYKEGIKDGVWRYYHSNGQLKIKETAQPSNKVKYKQNWYRKDGSLFTELVGINDDTIYFKKYFLNGRLAYELKNDGKRTLKKWTSFGNLFHYYDEDSIVYTIDSKTKKITHKGFFENGKRTGFWFKNYSNGKKEYEKTYKSGKLVGKFIEYFQNGNIDREVNYNTNGELEGAYKKYHQDGVPFVKGQYDSIGRRTGLWMYFNWKGKKSAIRNYKFNRLHGYYEDRYANGRLKERGYYRHDRKTGVWYYYNKRGKLKRKVKED